MRLDEIRQKGAPLSDETDNAYVRIYRAQPVSSKVIEPMSYVTRSRKFVRDHAVHMANTEEEPQHVVWAMVQTRDVYNAYNPGEYFYDGPAIEGQVVFRAKPGDDFE